MAKIVRMNAKGSRAILRSAPVKQRLEEIGRSGQEAAGDRVKMDSAVGKNRARVALIGPKRDLRTALKSMKRR